VLIQKTSILRVTFLIVADTFVEGGVPLSGGYTLRVELR
jgi:hypothetical protein